jgi:hypothetical protein
MTHQRLLSRIFANAFEATWQKCGKARSAVEQYPESRIRLRNRALVMEEQQAEIEVLSGFAADQRNDFGSGDSAGFGGGSSLKSQRLSAAASSACFWTERAFAYSVL